MIIINKNDKYSTEDFWNDAWISRFDHYQQDLRYAYYLNAIINDPEKSILEMGAGSFRDFAKLNELGHDCSAFDFSEKSVNLAQQQFPHLKNKITSDNAFHTKFSNNQFDLTYHNGLWCYFDMEDIKKLAKEQARITKKRMIFTLHNAHNKAFVDYFKKQSKKDLLYEIIFHTIDDAKDIVKDLCSELKIIPVGKGKKYYEDDLINIGLTDAKYIRRSFDYHQMNLLETSERLLCIGTLTK